MKEGAEMAAKRGATIIIGNYPYADEGCDLWQECCSCIFPHCFDSWRLSHKARWKLSSMANLLKPKIESLRVDLYCKAIFHVAKFYQKIYPIRRPSFN